MDWEPNTQFTVPSLITTPNNSQSPGLVIGKIEDIFESIVDCMLNSNHEIAIPLRIRSQQTRTPDDMVMLPQSNAKIRHVVFPSKNPREAWKFGEIHMRSYNPSDFI